MLLIKNAMLSLKMALRSIGSNKMRAMLTMLGIIIGVMALVVLVSLVNGATSSVTSTISSLGSSLITVTVSDDKGNPIRLETLEEWSKKERTLGTMVPNASDSLDATGKADSGTVTVYGTTIDYYTVQGLQLSEGRWLKASDMQNQTYAAVINETTAEELIGYTDCVGQAIYLGGIKFTVVGVLHDDDNNLTSVFGSGKMVAYVPYQMLIRLSTTVTKDITSYYIAAAEGFTLDDAENTMETILMERFEQDDDAFSISSQNALEDTMSSVTSMLTVMLGGIAAISLVVGGIGIMNIMMVTVTERTREIGIRKAIGATRGIILTQFLMEAVVLCMMGCCLGIFLSWAILQIVNTVVSSLSMTFHLNLTVVAIAVVFCFLIGIVFGLYPANKAAKMKPIDALHYGG